MNNDILIPGMLAYDYSSLLHASEGKEPLSDLLFGVLLGCAQSGVPLTDDMVKALETETYARAAKLAAKSINN